MPKILLFTACLLFSSAALFGQTWEIGLSAGGAGYMGDLNPNNPLKISGISAGGFIKRNFNGYLGIKGASAYGRIAAADSNSNNQQFRDRNLSFFNKLIEGSLVGEFNFMHYIPDAGKNVFTPFIFLGVGATIHAPRAIDANGTPVGLRPLKTEGQEDQYAETLIAIPYGAGIKYNIGGKWTLTADLGYRYTLTDYLDDVSGVYADASILKSPKAIEMADRSGEKMGSNIGFPGTQRGDGRKRDTYLLLNLSISFTFVPQRCYYE